MQAEARMMRERRVLERQVAVLEAFLRLGLAPGRPTEDDQGERRPAAWWQEAAYVPRGYTC